MCKRREAFSLAVLIGRGLVQVLLGLLLLLLYSVFRVRTLSDKSCLNDRIFSFTFFFVIQERNLLFVRFLLLYVLFSAMIVT